MVVLSHDIIESFVVESDLSFHRGSDGIFNNENERQYGRIYMRLESRIEPSVKPSENRLITDVIDLGEED